MIYDHPKDKIESHPVILLAWHYREIGLMCGAEVHLTLGTLFGYPPCCIAAFIFEAWPNDGGGGDIATDDRLGTYYHCVKCFETKKVLTSTQKPLL
jgi:hypothetical protein